MTVANDMIRIFRKPDGKDIAINALHVNTVEEAQYGKQYPKMVTITMTNGRYIDVADDFDFVLEQLSI